MGEEIIVNEEKTKRRGSFSVRFSFRRDSPPLAKDLHAKTNTEVTQRRGSLAPEKIENGSASINEEVDHDTDSDEEVFNDHEPTQRSGSFSEAARSMRFAFRRDSLPLATIRKAWLKGKRSISPESFLWRRRYGLFIYFTFR